MVIYLIHALLLILHFEKLNKDYEKMYTLSRGQACTCSVVLSVPSRQTGIRTRALQEAMG